MVVSALLRYGCILSIMPTFTSSACFWSSARVGRFFSWFGPGACDSREEEKGERREVDSHIAIVLGVGLVMRLEGLLLCWSIDEATL